SVKQISQELFCCQYCENINAREALECCSILSIISLNSRAETFLPNRRENSRSLSIFRWSKEVYLFMSSLSFSSRSLSLMLLRSALVIGQYVSPSFVYLSISSHRGNLMVSV